MVGMLIPNLEILLIWGAKRVPNKLRDTDEGGIIGTRDRKSTRTVNEAREGRFRRQGERRSSRPERGGARGSTTPATCTTGPSRVRTTARATSLRPISAAAAGPER